METNDLGGIENYSKMALSRARKVDLLTLPEDVKGTNCFNCKWIRSKTKEGGNCVNPKVMQLVNERMCCAIWDNDGAYREFGKMVNILK